MLCDAELMLGGHTVCVEPPERCTLGHVCCRVCLFCRPHVMSLIDDLSFLPAQVWLLDFSPCEKYLVTYSSQEPSNPREKASVLFNVFETRTGTCLSAKDANLRSSPSLCDARHCVVGIALKAGPLRRAPIPSSKCKCGLFAPSFCARHAQARSCGRSRAAWTTTRSGRRPSAAARSAGPSSSGPSGALVFACSRAITVQREACRLMGRCLLFET